jgi:hypothetical protein
METTLQVHSDLSLTAKIGPCEKWRLEAMAEIAVPIHDHAGCAEDREAESKEKPDCFDPEAP